jgi:hypothetical protein
MCYASREDALPIVAFRGRDIDKTEANVDKVILLVRTTVTIKPRRLVEINSVSFDQLINRQRSGGEAEQSQNPPYVLNIFICNTA